jgi:hypothetical protein
MKYRSHESNNPKNAAYAALRSWMLVIFVGVFIFSACSESATNFSADEPLINAEQGLLTELTLLQPDEPIIIDGIFDDATEMAKGRATSAAGNDRGRFNITLKYVVPVTPEQEQVFEDAAARWERIIIKDVPSFTGTVPSAFTGFPPAVDGTLDDIVIEVALAPIDGPGGVLGQAGPRFVRTSDNLTLSGLMFFDVEDLAFLDQLDLFEEVIVHEMGHVLGVGTLWGFNRDLIQGTAEAPYFTGKKANVFWNAEGGTENLPIEGFINGVVRPGTSFSHWDEGTLNNELMTGFLNLGENPLSRITAGSMRDLGYGSASVGESYDLPKGTPGTAAKAAGSGEGLDIASKEVLLTPIGFVNDKK